MALQGHNGGAAAPPASEACLRAPRGLHPCSSPAEYTDGASIMAGDIHLSPGRLPRPAVCVWVHLPHTPFLHRRHLPGSR